MTLVQGIIGQEYRVNNIDVDVSISRRLQALGLTPGTKVKVLNNKRSGSVIFKVRGTRLAIGRRIAEGISVSELNDKETNIFIKSKDSNNTQVMN